MNATAVTTTIVNAAASGTSSTNTTTFTIAIVGLVIAALAVGATIYVGMLTVRQGRVINNIETREHEWEQEDRRSAHIQVNLRTTQYVDQLSLLTIRLQNTGRSPAHDVTWRLEGIAETRNVSINETNHLATLHQGETYDPILFKFSVRTINVISLTVSWNDERGHHSKDTIIHA
jgi:hypothetical protein